MTGLVTIGVDPHRKVFTAAALDERGRALGHSHFDNTSVGHAAALAWARGMGTVDRVGVEGASGLGRPLAEYLVAQRIDVRDVPPHKTSLRQRGRHEGKSDRLDAHLVAAETQTNDALARAFKHSQPAPPDRVRDQIALWHNARTSLRKNKPPEPGPPMRAPRPAPHPPAIPGIAVRAAAEILLETGDVRRFTEPGFARFNGTAPIPASSGEAGARPVRHRLNRGGNRRLNAVLHRAAMIQLRCEPRARQLYDNALHNGHTKREAMRILKR